MALVVNDEDIQIEKLELAPYGTNAYIVICPKTRDSVLIDAPSAGSTIIEKLKGTNPQYILLTHNHIDHVGALDELRARLKVPLAAHASDAGNLSSPPERLLSNGDTVVVGNLSLEVRHTPGHTPGSLCFRVGHYLLSGDTLFPGGPGKTWSPEAFRQIVKSITERLFVLSNDTLIYPGHGEPTVLKKEKDEFAVFSSRPTNPNLCGDVLWLSS